MRKKRCDWCRENVRCIRSLKAVHKAAPMWAEKDILIVIKKLEGENRRCYNVS